MTPAQIRRRSIARALTYTVIACAGVAVIYLSMLIVTLAWDVSIP